MKKYHIIAGIFSLCLLLSGCGNSAESSEAESSSKSENTANIAETQANQDDEMEEIRKELEEQGYTPEEIADMLGETVANSGTDGTAAETESETVNPELFAYYDLLNQEYEKYGAEYYHLSNHASSDKIIISGIIGYTRGDINPSYANGYAIMNSHLITGTNKKNLWTYDTNTKEFKEIFPIDEDLKQNVYFYYNGYYYREFGIDITSTLNETKSLHLEKIDMDGNIVMSSDIPYSDIQQNCPDTSAYSHYVYIDFVTDNGCIIFHKGFFNDIPYTYYMISSDWKTAMALPQKAGEHGIMEDVASDNSLKFIACYQNKVYASDGSYVDVESMAWTESGADFSGYSPNTIGKYLILQKEGTAKIYDMEKDEFLVESLSAPDFAKTYAGTCNYIKRDDNKWYRVQYPSDGSSVNFSECEPLGTDTKLEYGYMYKTINDTYYLVHDEYGSFLRTYEKGETDEETITLNQ